MTGPELQLRFALCLRDFLASEGCALPLSWVGPLNIFPSTGDHYFTLSDGSHDFTISVQFEDPR